MKYILHTLLITVLILSCSAIGLPQQTGRKKIPPYSVRNKRRKIIGAAKGCQDYLTAGLIDEKALSKPSPNYPDEARAKSISGIVIVEITIDISGNVMAARAVSGPPLLLKAAVDAAYRARFPVARASGQPIKLMAKVKYDFVL